MLFQSDATKDFLSNTKMPGHSEEHRADSACSSPKMKRLFAGNEKSCSIKVVTIRQTIFFLVAFLWASAPVLACFPSSAMTDAEMACCKKMAGNCEMGAGNHSCCNTTMKTSQTVAAAAQNPQAQLPSIMVAVSSSFNSSITDIASEGVYVEQSPIPISPPGLQSILRI